jgi:hypothetical protein
MLDFSLTVLYWHLRGMSRKWVLRGNPLTSLGEIVKSQDVV